MSQDGGVRSGQTTVAATTKQNTSNNIASMAGNNNVLSHGSLSKGGQTQHGLFSIISGDNPSYTVKDGGTLKKKLQPYAAD